MEISITTEMLLTILENCGLENNFPNRIKAFNALEAVFKHIEKEPKPCAFCKVPENAMNAYIKDNNAYCSACDRQVTDRQIAPSLDNSTQLKHLVEPGNEGWIVFFGEKMPPCLSFESRIDVKQKQYDSPNFNVEAKWPNWVNVTHYRLVKEDTPDKKTHTMAFDEYGNWTAKPKEKVPTFLEFMKAINKEGVPTQSTIDLSEYLDKYMKEKD